MKPLCVVWRCFLGVRGIQLSTVIKNINREKATARDPTVTLFASRGLHQELPVSWSIAIWAIFCLIFLAERLGRKKKTRHLTFRNQFLPEFCDHQSQLRPSKSSMDWAFSAKEWSPSELCNSSIRHGFTCLFMKAKSCRNPIVLPCVRHKCSCYFKKEKLEKYDLPSL